MNPNNKINTKGIILYDYQPFSKGKYKQTTSKMAIKKLCFIKNLKLTSPQQFFCWDISNSPLALKRLFKLCKSFKTSFKIPNKLSCSLKSAPLKRLSLSLPQKSNYVLMKRSGVKYPLSRITLKYPNKTKHLSTVLSILKGKINLVQIKLRLPEESYSIKEKELGLFTKGMSKLKALQTINMDTYYFASKITTVRSLLKTMATWNLVSLQISIDLSQLQFESLALGLSLLASMKSLRSFEMELIFINAGDQEQSFNEVVKAFQTFIKNQFKLNSLSFCYRTQKDTTIPAEIFKGIEKMKYLETLTLSPCCGNWNEKDMDIFVSVLGGHPKLKRLELIFNDLPKAHIDQFYKRLEAGLHGVKRLGQLKMVGTKIPGLVLEKAVSLMDLFENLRRLEFCLLLQQNSAEAGSFAKLISSCGQLQDVMLGINQTVVLNEQILNQILEAIGSLEKLVSVELSLGRVKREGNKHIFGSFFERLERMWSFRVKFVELFLGEEDILLLGKNLVQKKQLRSVILAGNFPSISKDVKDWFVSTLRNQGIKTPPLT